MLAPNLQLNPPLPPNPSVGKTCTYRSEEVPSCGGHGTFEILEVTRFLEHHGIECCLVGVSALIFYGAGRVRNDWELCIPTERVGEVVSLLKSGHLADKIHPTAPHPIPQPSSLHHTYHRFKGRGIHFYFLIVPSHDAHIPCRPFRIQRSLNGLPYPTLPILLQSFLDMNNDVALCDCIDGSNISERWGYENLDLDGTNDLEWTKRMNATATQAAKGKGWLFVQYFPTQIISRREKWQNRVRSKKGRLGWTTPEDLFETRFRMKGSPDPWTQKLISC